jgi:hypothetical protein
LLNSYAGRITATLIEVLRALCGDDVVHAIEFASDCMGAGAVGLDSLKHALRSAARKRGARSWWSVEQPIAHTDNVPEHQHGGFGGLAA